VLQPLASEGSFEAASALLVLSCCGASAHHRTRDTRHFSLAFFFGGGEATHTFFLGQERAES
jgi:hypothetical protein